MTYANWRQMQRLRQSQKAMKRNESQLSKASCISDNKFRCDNLLGRSVQHSLSNILQVADRNSQDNDVESGKHQYNQNGRRLKKKRSRDLNMSFELLQEQPQNHTKSLLMKNNPTLESSNSENRFHRDSDVCTDIVILPDTQGKGRNRHNVRAFNTTQLVTFS